MSTYSIISIIIMAVTIVVVVVAKIRMRKQRKELDGVHGFAHRVDPGKTKTDDWDDLQYRICQFREDNPYSPLWPLGKETYPKNSIHLKKHIFHKMTDTKYKTYANLEKRRRET